MSENPEDKSQKDSSRRHSSRRHSSRRHSSSRDSSTRDSSSRDSDMPQSNKMSIGFTSLVGKPKKKPYTPRPGDEVLYEDTSRLESMPGIVEDLDAPGPDGLRSCAQAGRRYGPRLAAGAEKGGIHEQKAQYQKFCGR